VDAEPIISMAPWWNYGCVASVCRAACVSLCMGEGARGNVGKGMPITEL
jgi:hypothetical protein